MTGVKAMLRYLERVISEQEARNQHKECEGRPHQASVKASHHIAE